MKMNLKSANKQMKLKDFFFWSIKYDFIVNWLRFKQYLFIVDGFIVHTFSRAQHVHYREVSL